MNNTVQKSVRFPFRAIVPVCGPFSPGRVTPRLA